MNARNCPPAKHFFSACVLGSVRLVFDTGCFCKVSSDGDLQLRGAVSYILSVSTVMVFVSILTVNDYCG